VSASRSPAPSPAPSPDWLPAWVSRVGFACWLCDPEGRIAYWNARAEALFERPAGDVVGQPCHGVVGGTDGAGERVCRPDCRVARIAREGRPIPPLTFRRGSSQANRGWILVATTPLAGPDGSGPWLLHCVHDVDSSQRPRGYVERIAKRSGPLAAPSSLAKLSRREREVLERLADDEDPKGVARRLHVSYATVRNHIQHILAKLGVHSLQEAIALHLLEE